MCGGQLSFLRPVRYRALFVFVYLLLRFLASPSPFVYPSFLPSLPPSLPTLLSSFPSFLTIKKNYYISFSHPYSSTTEWLLISLMSIDSLVPLCSCKMCVFPIMENFECTHKRKDRVQRTPHLLGQLRQLSTRGPSAFILTLHSIPYDLKADP